MPVLSSPCRLFNLQSKYFVHSYAIFCWLLRIFFSLKCRFAWFCTKVPNCLSRLARLIGNIVASVVVPFCITG